MCSFHTFTIISPIAAMVVVLLIAGPIGARRVFSRGSTANLSCEMDNLSDQAHRALCNLRAAEST